MPGFARVLRAQQVQQLPARLVLQHDPVGDVWPVEAGDEVARATQVEPGGDLGPGGVGRRRGQGDPRHVRPPLVQRGQFEVIGPEVVPPLGHAVRLVDREQRDPAAIEQPHRRFGPQPLRRQVEQVQLAGQERRLDPPPLARLLGRVEEPGPHALRGQRVHLVLHQRDERGDDHAGAVPDERRDLVAQRLAAAGRHEHERVPAAGNVVDDLPLPAPERLVPEHAPQDLQRPVGHRVDCCHARDPTGKECQCWPGGTTPRNPPLRCAGRGDDPPKPPTNSAAAFMSPTTGPVPEKLPARHSPHSRLHIPWNDQVQAECPHLDRANPATSTRRPVSGTEHPAMSVPTGTLTTQARPRGQRRSQQTKSSSTRDCKRGSMKSPSQ